VLLFGFCTGQPLECNSGIVFALPLDPILNSMDLFRPNVLTTLTQQHLESSVPQGQATIRQSEFEQVPPLSRTDTDRLLDAP
jgi:hypothetical protein